MSFSRVHFPECRHSGKRQIFPECRHSGNRPHISRVSTIGKVSHVSISSVSSVKRWKLSRVFFKLIPECRHSVKIPVTGPKPFCRVFSRVYEFPECIFIHSGKFYFPSVTLGKLFLSRLIYPECCFPSVTLGKHISRVFRPFSRVFLALGKKPDSRKNICRAVCTSISLLLRSTVVVSQL